VAVGFIALAGLAAEFGVVMLVYLRNSLNRRIEAGQPLARELTVEAIREGACCGCGRRR
jgi:Cu(I)/Ag(I) efflux system membrane protein CusA/SilA